MTSIFEHRDVIRTVLANFTRRDAGAFLSTSKLVSRCGRDPDCTWRLHTDIEEALARVRKVCDFGPDDFERNEGSGWRLCLQLLTRAMYEAVADGVLRYSAAEAGARWNLFGWSEFHVNPKRERQWRQRMLDLVVGNPIFHEPRLTRYRYDSKNPTWCVYLMLEDLGFSQTIPRRMPFDAALKYDAIWSRHWVFCHTRLHMTFFRDVRRIQKHVRRAARVERAGSR
ncbi:MAG: hypothetical protein EBR09_14655 [Proteobacteria bacterium]|jgi:hypothetical protein|nr:hypothetical protein [Pseudomonadota bacterium]